MNPAPNRVHGLDLIRGLCAIAVCVHHVLLWTGGPELRTLGTYGVYIFFVVSGASLYIGYADTYRGLSDFWVFLARRFIRLAPLYIGVVSVSVLVKAILTGDLPGVWTLALNFSLLFGFAGAGATSLVTGGWSIGIEIVFYVAFPLFLSMVKSRFWIAVLLGAFLLQHAYIQLVLDDAFDLFEVWVSYTQPISFVFYFLAGMSIVRAMKPGYPAPAWRYWLMLAALLATLILIPDPSYKSILSGMTGWILSLVTVLTALVSIPMRMGATCAKIADTLGSMSYGLYLIHPLVYGVLVHMAPQGFYPWALAACTTVASGILALLVDHFYEKPVGRTLQSRLRRRIRRAKEKYRSACPADCRWAPAASFPSASESRETSRKFPTRSAGERREVSETQRHDMRLTPFVQE